MAKWNIYDNRIPDFSKHDGERKNYWNDEDAQAYQEHISKQFFQEREAAIVRTNGNIVCLDILAVDPAYQKQGIGSALVEWGVKKADRMGVEAVVESSVFEEGLYERYDFVYVKDIVCHPGSWAEPGGQEVAWLVRPNKT